MERDWLVHALDGMPGAQVSVDAGRVTVRVSALDDTVRLDPGDVLSADPVDVPTGAPAVQLAIRWGDDEIPLIVTVDDVVFWPAEPVDLVAPDMAFPLPAAPYLIAYSEMRRDVRALGQAVADRELEPEMLAATLLMQRCFVVGAIRVGLWPVRVAAWWEYTWAKSAARLLLPPWRADPDWDRLMADVAEARRRTAAIPS
jgi:hypothetical protein